MVTPAARGGVFLANPLSLSVPEPAFESWLRDSGYLEILDERSSTTTSSSSSATTTPSHKLNPSSCPLRTTSSSTTSSSSASGLLRLPNSSSGGSSLFCAVRTFLSIFSINPFAKLTADDFSGATPSWTAAFFTGSGAAAQLSSYSCPVGPSQARMRVQENVKRYARNYAFLSLLVFACSLYKMPTALFGLMSSLALWEVVRLCSERWELEERHPSLRHVLVVAAQFATAAMLYWCKIQVALVCAISISYTVMILHASLRKLTPSKLVGDNRHKRSHQNRQ